MSTQKQWQLEVEHLRQENAALKQANLNLQHALATHNNAQQQTESALQASEAELRALFAAMSDIVIVKDFHGRYLKIAPTQLGNLYKLPEELIGRTEHDILPKETADQFVGYIQTVLTTQQAITVEYSLPIRGDDRWFSTNVAPLSSNSVIWVARDITERKHTEEALIRANQEIMTLNDRLKQENLRMSAELEVTQRLQSMMLPREEELKKVTGLDISGWMQSATEVGGDYYDVLQHNGKVQIGIGDVTGHGLESSVVMLMAQSAVRTLLTYGETNLVKLLNTVNRLIYDNTRRMRSPKNMSLALLEYNAGCLHLTGQHEELIIVRADGAIESVDTQDLGFPLGLESDITTFVAEATIQLHAEDIAVLYTDGVTEAIDFHQQQYGLERLYGVLRHNRDRSALEIRRAVMDDLMQYIGQQKVFDDITLLVLKQK